MLLIGSLTGCVTASSREPCGSGLPAEGFVLSNQTSTIQRCRVSITREFIVHTEKVFSRQYDLGPDGSSESRLEETDVAPIAGPHVIEVELENDDVLGTHLWEVTTDRCDALRISINEDSISFEDVGRY